MRLDSYGPKKADWNLDKQQISANVKDDAKDGQAKRTVKVDRLEATC